MTTQRSQALSCALSFLPKVVFALVDSFDYTLEGVVEVEIRLKSGQQVRELCSLSNDRLLGIVEQALFVWDVITGDVLWTQNYAPLHKDSVYPVSLHVLKTQFVVKFAIIKMFYAIPVIKIYDSNTYALLNQIAHYWTDEPAHVQDLDDGNTRLAIAEGEHELVVYDCNRNLEQRSIRFQVAKAISHVNCLSDGQIVLVCGYSESFDHSLRVFQCSPGSTALQIYSEPLPRNPRFSRVSIKCSASLHNGILVGGSSSDFGYIALFRNLKLEREILIDKKEPIRTIFMIDSEQVVFDSNTEITIWNLISGQKEAFLKETGLDRFIGLLPDCQIAAVSFVGFEIRILDPYSKTKSSIVVKDKANMTVYNFTILGCRFAYCFENVITVLR